MVNNLIILKRLKETGELKERMGGFNNISFANQNC